MKLRKEEIYILCQKHIHRLTYRAVTKTDQKSALSLLGRLQSCKFCFRAISRIFYISVLAGKYQRHPKHLIFKTVKDDVDTRTGLPLENSPNASWLWVCPVLSGEKQGSEAMGVWSWWCRRLQQPQVRSSPRHPAAPELSDLESPRCKCG